MHMTDRPTMIPLAHLIAVLSQLTEEQGLAVADLPIAAFEDAGSMETIQSAQGIDTISQHLREIARLLRLVGESPDLDRIVELESLGPFPLAAVLNRIQGKAAEPVDKGEVELF